MDGEVARFDEQLVSRFALLRSGDRREGLADELPAVDAQEVEGSENEWRRDL